MLSVMDIDAARELWDLDTTWLNTAQVGVPPRPAHAALEAALRDWQRGSPDPAGWSAAAETARARFAELTGAEAADITQGASTAQLLGTVASSAPDGARILVPEGDYASTIFPWMAQAPRGLEVRSVPLGELAGAIDADTWLVVFSLVQSATGEVAPCGEILRQARRHGCLVAGDATQALGWLPVDATGYDALVCSSYKWLMAPRGLAYGYFSPRIRPLLYPVNAGPSAAADPMASLYTTDMRLARDASRFDLSPNWFASVVAAESMRVLLEVGIDRVHAHDTAVANRFLEVLGLAPRDSAIVAVDVPGGARRLWEAGIPASERGGRTRLAFHLYSTTADAEQAAKALL